MALSIWLSYIGTKQMELAGRIQDKTSALKFMPKSPSTQLVVCVSNKGFAVSLERRKIYVSVSDTQAAKHGLVRIIDESGDDYLYPKALFRSIALPRAVKQAVLAAA